MVPGVADIPLAGKTLAVNATFDRPASDDRGTKKPPHHDAVAETAFVVGDENRLAEVAIRSVVEGQPNGYNPLVLYGASGTGKSHLAADLVEAWKARDSATVRPERPHSQANSSHTDARHGNGRRSNAEQLRHRAIHATAVDFARELADAIETQAVDEFREKHRGAGMLVIEDLGQLATRRSGKLSAQEELVHTIDALVADGRWVIVTSSAAPWELPGIVPMLQSRLAAGLVVRLSPPGRETRVALLRQLAAAREIELPEPVAQALADGVSGTARDLAGAFFELATPREPSLKRRPAANGAVTPRVTTSGVKKLDLAAVQKYLARGRRERKVTVHEIALATARHFAVRLSELRSASRRRALVSARGVAVYLARDVAGQALEEIGRYFGGRDHTTVLHSYRTTKTLAARDPATRAAVEEVKNALWKT